MAEAADVGAVVPAAGVGVRLGRRPRKALVPLDGQPLILQTLYALHRAATIRWIVVAVHQTDRIRVASWVRKAGLSRVTAVIAGGASRAESVARAMTQLPAQARWVMVHDGARPCVKPQLVDRVVKAAKQEGAAACGLRAALTVKTAEPDGRVRLTLDRDGLWLMQTPQAFRRDWWQEALARIGSRLEQFPDDVAVLEWAGFPVRVVEGDPLNLKVTTRDDLLLAEAILKNRKR